MPRLLYAVNIPRFFVTHRLPLALAARDAGYEVHVATSAVDRENVARIQAHDLPFHPLPLSQHGTGPLTELRTLLALIALYRRLKPDLVHQVTIKPVLYGGIAAHLTGIPAVVSAMSGLGYVFINQSAKVRLIRALVQPVFRVALAGQQTRMIFQNPDDQQQFVNLNLISAARTVLIRGSGVDTARFQPQPEPDGQPVVLFAGRLMWKKGPGDFVAMAKRLHGQARFVVAGYAESTSPDMVSPQWLSGQAEAGWIEWIGKQDDMPAVFAQSHIVCLPSSYGEGVPKVLIEAAACARAIVTTDTPGCREIVKDGINGRLVPAGDVDALVTAVSSLIADRERRQQMGAAGRKIVLDDFTLTQVLEQTFELYDLLLQPA